MDLQMITTQLLGGLTRASVLFVLASGLTLIFGVARVINFAHGAFYMLAVYLSYSALRFFGTEPLGFFTSLVVVAVALGLVGGVVETVLIRRIYHREHLEQLLLTFALVFVLADVVRFFWGVNPKSASRPAFLEGAVQVAGSPFPIYNAFVIAQAIAVAVLLWAILTHTRFGWLIRGVAADREITAALGVNVPWLLTSVFVLGCALVGLGGMAAAPLTAAALGMDFEMVVLCFIVVIVGGAGNFLGAALAALLVGCVDALGILILPQFTVLFSYVLVAVVMILRPHGILARPAR